VCGTYDLFLGWRGEDKKEISPVCPERPPGGTHWKTSLVRSEKEEELSLKRGFQ